MSDIKKELKKLIPLYCSELDTLEVYMYADYEFSDKYIRNKEKLIRQQSRVYYPLIKTTGRRIISAILAAALIGSITVAAYEPAREAVRRAFEGKDEIVAVEKHRPIPKYEPPNPYVTKFDYTFSNKTDKGICANGHILPLIGEKTIKIHFYSASPAPAAVTIINGSDRSITYDTFVIPIYAGTELTYTTTLPSGIYMFSVVPYNGDETSGDFWVEIVRKGAIK